MKKLYALAAICAATLFVSACVGLVTASPTVAQSGGPRPSDVKVVNTAAEAVPTQVTSLPAVQVSSLPAVQVGNAATNPVPVTVTNPAQTYPSQTAVAANVSFMTDDEGNNRTFTGNLYQVPAGKRLVIEHASMSYYTSFDSIDEIRYLHGALFTTLNGQEVRHIIGGGKHAPGTRTLIDSRPVRIYADAGSVVRWGLSFEGAILGGGGQATLSMSGHLEPAN